MGSGYCCSFYNKIYWCHGTSIGGVVVEKGDFPWNNGKFPELTEPDPSYHGLKFFEALGPMKLAYILKMRLQLLRDVGAAMSPFNAFQFLQGLETLHLRMERHSKNAQQVAEFLASHPKVSWVNHTGLPSHPSYQLGKKYLPKVAVLYLDLELKGQHQPNRKKTASRLLTR